MGTVGRDSHWVQSIVQIVGDITVRQEGKVDLCTTEQVPYDENEQAQLTLDSIAEAVVSTDILGNVRFMNRVAVMMTGWSREEALGRPLSEVFKIIDGQTHVTAQDPARHAMEEGRAVALAAGSILVRRDGGEIFIEDSAAPIHDRDGLVMGAVIVFHDVSQKQLIAQQMRHLAHHDFLTGLPNRILLIDHISQAIALAERHRKKMALVFMDLDNFKRVNDSLGHAAGDQVLRCVAKRLTECVRATDTLCRQGGDEFVMLLSEIERQGDADQVMGKLRAALAVPQLLGERKLIVTLSAGISVFPDDGVDIDTLMRNADTAMYRAKASGGDRCLFYGKAKA